MTTSDPDRELSEAFTRWKDGDDRALQDLLHWAYETMRLRAHEELGSATTPVGTTEVANEAACRVLDDIDRERTPSLRAFFAYVGQKIRYTLIDLLRKQSREQGRGGGDDSTGPPLEPAAKDPSPSQAVSREEERARLLEAVESLPQELRIFDLHQMNGMTLVRVAESLQVNYDTVKKRWSRVRRQLGERLDAEGPPPQ